MLYSIDKMENMNVAMQGLTHCGDLHLLILDGPVCVWTWTASRLRTPGDSAWLASAEVQVRDVRSPPSALLPLLCCSQGK